MYPNSKIFYNNSLYSLSDNRSKQWRSVSLKTMQLFDLETRNQGEFW